jgi:hypothetical protein
MDHVRCKERGGYALAADTKPDTRVLMGVFAAYPSTGR